MSAGTCGATLVLLHGFLGRPSAWDAVIDALGPGEPLDVSGAPIETRGRIVFPGGGPAVTARALALPGHGPMPWVPDGGRFEAWIDALAARLPGEPVFFAGYSMGARVALALAVRHPARVRAATLVGPDVGLRDERARAERRGWDDGMARRIEEEGVPRFADDWEKLPLFASQRDLPAALLGAQRRERTEQRAAAVARAMRVLGLGSMPPLWGPLAACPVPLRFLAGDRDEKFTAIGREAARLAPRARFVPVAGAGHNLPLERPAAVAGEIRDMLIREHR